MALGKPKLRPQNAPLGASGARVEKPRGDRQNRTRNHGSHAAILTLRD